MGCGASAPATAAAAAPPARRPARGARSAEPFAPNALARRDRPASPARSCHLCLTHLRVRSRDRRLRIRGRRGRGLPAKPWKRTPSKKSLASMDAVTPVHALLDSHRDDDGEPSVDLAVGVVSLAGSDPGRRSARTRTRTPRTRAGSRPRPAPSSRYTTATVPTGITSRGFCASASPAASSRTRRRARRCRATRRPPWRPRSAARARTSRRARSTARSAAPPRRRCTSAASSSPPRGSGTAARCSGGRRTA